MHEIQRRSSRSITGRFSFFIFYVFSFFPLLHASVTSNIDSRIVLNIEPGKEMMNPSGDDKNTGKQNPSETDKADKAVIYITGGAELSDAEHAIQPDVIIITDYEKKHTVHKKNKEKVKAKPAESKGVKHQKPETYPTASFYFANPQDREFHHFDSGPDKMAVTTHHQIKVISVDRMFILSIMLLMSIFIMCLYEAGTFFMPFAGKNFQRPPPACFFSTYL